jgi:hypothetical protein
MNELVSDASKELKGEFHEREFPLSRWASRR